MVGDHTFPSFPKGGWWITWIDHAPRFEKAVHVVLAPVGERSLLVDDLGRLRPRLFVCRADRAALPLLACGDIYKDKRPTISQGQSAIRSVCDLAPFGAARTFRFDTAKYANNLDAAGGSTIDEALSLDESLRAYDAYPLTTTKNSRVLVVDAEDGCRYLIPAAEIIRSAVAPHSRLVSDVFGETLFSYLTKTIDVYASSSDEAGHFNLKVKEAVDDGMLPYLVNMVRKYNKHGASAIGRIFPSMRDSDPLLVPGIDSGRLRYVTDGASPLPVCLPFGSGVMTIRAKCIVLGPRFYLVAKVLGGTWPPLPPLRVTMPASEVDPDFSPTPRPRPSRPGVGRTGAADGVDQIDLVDPPSTSGRPVAVSVERLTWENLPLTEVERQKVSRAGTYAVPAPERNLHGTSMGDADSSGTHHQGVADHADRDPPDRFRLTHDALDRLAEAGRIRGHQGVVHVDIDGRPLQSIRLRGIDVWALPAARTTSWTTLPASDGKRRSRTLYLRRVILADGVVVYWISIEVPDDDGRRAVSIGFGERATSPDDVPPSEALRGPLSRAVGQLIATRGRIADALEFERKVGADIMRIGFFSHRSGQFIPPDPDKAGVQGPPVAAPERFSDDRVFGTLSDAARV